MLLAQQETDSTIHLTSDTTCDQADPESPASAPRKLSSNYGQSLIGIRICYGEYTMKTNGLF